MTEKIGLRIVGTGCLLAWAGVAIENITGQPLLVLAGVLAP